MDTPWLYVYMALKLSQLQHGMSHFTSEITTRKMVTIHSLILDGLYRERGRDREAHLYLFTPTVSYLKVVLVLLYSAYCCTQIGRNTDNPCREVRLYVFALFQVGGHVISGKRRVNASCSISAAWMPALRGEISLGNGKELKTLDMNTSFGKENLNISASLNIVDKV